MRRVRMYCSSTLKWTLKSSRQKVPWIFKLKIIGQDFNPRFHFESFILTTNTYPQLARTFLKSNCLQKLYDWICSFNLFCWVSRARLHPTKPINRPRPAKTPSEQSRHAKRCTCCTWHSNFLHMNGWFSMVLVWIQDLTSQNYCLVFLQMCRNQLGF